jgi:hypothetical protein
MSNDEGPARNAWPALFSPARLFPPPLAEIAVFESSAATAATRSTAAAAAAAAKSPFGLRSRFVHHERASVHLMLVKLADRALCFIVGRHLDKRKPARASGGHVTHDADAVYFAGSAEQVGQLLFCCRVWKVSYVESPAHLSRTPAIAIRADGPRSPYWRACNQHAVSTESSAALQNQPRLAQARQGERGGCQPAGK